MKVVSHHNAKRSIFLAVANNIYWFHLLWIIVLLIGAIVQWFYHPYAYVQFGLTIGTAIFQLLGKGHCPLSLFENLIYEKYAPEKMYYDSDTFKGSFIRHFIKQKFKRDAPEGTTLFLLIAVFVTNIIVLIFF